MEFHYFRDTYEDEELTKLYVKEIPPWRRAVEGILAVFAAWILMGLVFLCGYLAWRAI